MRVVYFDCASGASGDMLLGALVDMGLPVEALRSELGKLPLTGYRLEARRVARCGMAATKVDVEHSHEHAHRGLREILELLDRSALDPIVKERSAGLFRRLAEAEAAVHDVAADQVRFHEVGAVDSIVDIVGGVWGLTQLRAERFVASPLNLGTGTVTMSHGTFAVPPPATERLVRGVPVYAAGEGERLTPTGALLVTGYATAYGPLPLLRPEATGHGAGARDTTDRPNVLRLIVGEEGAAPEKGVAREEGVSRETGAAREEGVSREEGAAREGSVPAPGGDRVLVLEAEVDDMSPQLCGPLLDRLLSAGALDVYYTPIQMKKGRPGILVTVLVEPRGREAIEEALFAETTTLGVRRQEWDRTVLDRAVVPVETLYGMIGVKVGRRGGRVYNVQPEFDDCHRAALARGVPVKEVLAAALAAYRAARH